MVSRVADQWQNLKSGLWFLPTLVALALAALAVLLLQLDQALRTGEVGLLFGGDASAARGILSTIAGSLITVAVLTLSITIVVLQLASSQYSPRVLRTFLGDRITQVTAGAFVGLFVYCLLVLREVRAGDDKSEFVPSLSVTVAIALAVLALGLLLVFINNISNLVQVENIVERIYESLVRAVGNEPAGGEGVGGDVAAAIDGAGGGVPVFPRRTGYVQRIALERAAGQLDDGEWSIEVLVVPGDFVAAHDPVARVWRPRDVGERAKAAICSAFTVTSQRDVHEDPGFAIRQLADVAIRALSPSLSDPTSALLCVSYLRAGLVALARAHPPERVRQFANGRVTLVVPYRTLVEYARPLLEVGRHAIGEPRVSQAVLVAVAEIAATARGAGRADEADELAEHGRELGALVAAEAETESDRDAVDELARQLG